MRRYLFVTSLAVISWLILIVVSGCGGGALPGQPGVSAGRGSSANVGDQRLTVVLAVYSQPDRVQLAQQLKTRAEKLLNTNDIWLQNIKIGLAVNYGHFADNDQAEVHKKKVKQIYKQLMPGRLQFCYIAELPAPDPPAEPGWNLLNSSCSYTLEIGTYFDLPEHNYFDRKQDALRAVRALRSAGEIAFFVHGQFESRVYVGCISVDELDSYRKGTGPLQQRYPYRGENGAKINVIAHDDQGRVVRIPKRSLVVDIEEVKREVMF